MQKSTFSILAISFLFLVFCFSSTAQTHVSGGIYSNATWTLAGSPYIVDTNIVVFPGVTLTIQPGVTVKFADGTNLEIRQGILIAAGTAADSITFTSNSPNPHMSIWQKVFFNNPDSVNLDYCIFRYGYTPLVFSLNSTKGPKLLQHISFYDNESCFDFLRPYQLIRLCKFYNNYTCQAADYTNIDSCIYINNHSACGYASGGVNIVNSTFIGNGTAIGTFDIANFHILNCIFINNSTGISSTSSVGGGMDIRNSIFCNNGTAYSNSQNSDSIVNCNFSHNHIGCYVQDGWYIAKGCIFTDNDTAMVLRGESHGNYVYHNHVGIVAYYIQNIGGQGNYVCNNTLYNLVYNGYPNADFTNVCWCDTNISIVSSKIYDTLNYAHFVPLNSCDSSLILALSPINCQTVVLTGVEENTNHLINEELEIYPNPASDQLTLNLIISKAQFKIYNMLGEMKYSSIISSRQATVDISALANGVYLIEVNTENNILRQKFIKQQGSR